MFLCPFEPTLGFALLAWTWVLSLSSSFPPLPGALFDGACQGFIIIISGSKA